MYKYEELKAGLFTENGQVMFLGIRDNTKKLLATSGAVSMFKAISTTTGDSWLRVACVDRLVELGEIRELNIGNGVSGQNRVFVPAE